MIRHLAIVLFGAAIMQVAVAIYLNLLPAHPFFRIAALCAVAVVPSSALLTIAALGVGLIQLPFKAVRGSGRMMSSYSGRIWVGCLLGGASSTCLAFRSSNESMAFVRRTRVMASL
jgi:hypothetical protein